MPAKSNTGKKRKLNDVSPSSSNQDPSDILRALSISLPPNTFIKLLEKGLYPVLDALPTAHKTTVSNALTEVNRPSDKILRKIKAVGYDEHKKSLEDGVKALNKSVKRDWKNGWEEQGEMMGEIADEVLEWLPVLWRTAVEDGLELPLIRKCLLLCTETVNKVSNCNSRSEFCDMDFEVTITNSDEVTIYEEASADIDHTLAWMWKEILITAATKGAPTKDIESDIERLKIKNDVYSFIRKDGGKSSFNVDFLALQFLKCTVHLVENTYYTGYEFWDAHWTTAMKKTASRLLVSRHAAHIASFKEAPSFRLYKRLVKESPDLKATLLEATRTAILPSSPSARPTITYGAATDIFRSSSQTDDLARLLKTIPQYSSDTTVGRAERTIIKSLSKQSAAKHHKTALDAIARGLNNARQNTLDEVKQAFPGFDEAYGWLEEQIDNKKLTHKAPWGAKSYHAMTAIERKVDVQRQKYLDGFVQRAARGSDEYGYGGTVDDFDDPMDGMDSDDRDYEEQKNARCPDLVSAIGDWVAMLQEWPDKNKAAKVWDQVKQTDAEGDLLFTVDGLAEALASRYVSLRTFILFINVSMQVRLGIQSQRRETIRCRWSQGRLQDVFSP